MLPPPIEVRDALDVLARPRLEVGPDCVRDRDQRDLRNGVGNAEQLPGFALVRELRSRERTRAIPIILLSARAGEEAAVEGLQSGADDYLVKPFSARELIARVRSQLELARMRAEAAKAQVVEQDLRAAISMRDEFLNAASHELRTPLTTLRLQ